LLQAERGEELNENKPDRLVVIIGGASDIANGIWAREMLWQRVIETHLVVTPAA